MLIIKVNNGKIEQAIKNYRSKVIKTRQMRELQDRKEFVKKSVRERESKRKQFTSVKNIEKKINKKGDLSPLFL